MEGGIGVSRSLGVADCRALIGKKANDSLGALQSNSAAFEVSQPMRYGAVGSIDQSALFSFAYQYAFSNTIDVLMRPGRVPSNHKDIDIDR